MAINPDPLAPYREEPRDLYAEPRSSSTDNASVLWIIGAAALAALFLIWFLSATSVRIPDSVDTNAVSAVETPLTPPEPVPATRPRPTP
jgi:hypothetical protein